MRGLWSLWPHVAAGVMGYIPHMKVRNVTVVQGMECNRCPRYGPPGIGPSRMGKSCDAMHGQCTHHGDKSNIESASAIVCDDHTPEVQTTAWQDVESVICSRVWFIIMIIMCRLPACSVTLLEVSCAADVHRRCSG